MNKKQYNNVIEYTVKHQQTEDSLSTARAVFTNMGIPLPQGDMKMVYETIKTDNYMAWRPCTMQEAQAAADRGKAAIGISEDRIVVLSAKDEEQPVTQTASVMTLSETTSAFAVADLAYYSYGYTQAGQARCGGTVCCKETVTIKKDGSFNKVVFESTGKVWRCINHDMIFDENNINNPLYTKRSKHNFFTYYNEENPVYSDTRPRKYTDNEIKLLYAIDPYGVADYVQRYANEKPTLKETVEEKDRIFRLLFGREPKYFARTLNGVWYEVDDYEEINDVLSESEAYFGGHPVYDLHTFFEILGVCSSILNIVFLTNFFTSTVAGVIVSRIVKTGLLVASGIESVLRNEFANYDLGDLIESAIDNTLPDWASDYVSLYESLDDLADAMTLNFNYNKEIIKYCACHTGYNVLFEMKNGTVYNLKEVCDKISK